ncbi:2',3'-cyclic-nucleotide 2'-phosphodiesterase/3'-nucleotidase [Mumia flava]|uniref:2',3'-cyclic-nucleotide 2'-phosphodiesterase/3'-nucleotidase n=1 Tax=Mumia flava TaxID=1348852 RepID=A0A0B2B0K6_9ACTN|nr:5'-nucleotidase C-terminal domain-containing protein [Mumia flava]PJJ56636.1 2',3'-cyclic-nucleotide 2'-phosphodiesterase/3'-nucleotidase [Mumia flava]
MNTTPEENPSQHVTRRTLISGSAAAAALAAAGYAAPAAAKPKHGHGHGHHDSATFTVLGTTDLHGNVFNWDYFKNAEYDDSAHNDIGLAKISTLVDAMRRSHTYPSPLLIDAGDTIQGTSLAYYFAKVEPISRTVIHPMARAMNAIGYDAAALGNHEFNYGIPLLRRFERQCDFPLLGANAHDATTGLPAFPPFVIKKVKVGRHLIRVGILGLTNPGIAIWDKANVEGTMVFPGLVEEAAHWVPRMRRAGADVVIVSAHSGADTSSSYGDALPYPENAASLVAEQVPGIDAILVGHAHAEIAQRVVTNIETGRPVVLTEPLRWGMRLSALDVTVRKTRGRYEVTSVSAQVLNANTVEEDPEIVRLLRRDHETVVAYVNSVIGTATEAMSAATARYEDTAALDFINVVQAGAVKDALVGSPSEGLPVLSIAAPFNREAAIPAGEVSVRDVAGLYIYDNTLLGIRMSGAQIAAYLEKSAEYFKAVPGPGTYAAGDVTNAPTATAPNGTPDYNYDVMGGLDAPLTYDIDLTAPVGSRIVGLAYGGVPVAAGDQFVVAINNYRQSGGGNFPGVTSAEVVYNAQVEIRQLLIDWVSAQGVIDPPTFHQVDWRLVAGSTPLTITG